MLNLWTCSLGSRAFSFDSGASGRANDRQPFTLEVIAYDVSNLLGKFANGCAAVFLHQPVFLGFQGAAFWIHV